VRLDLTRPPLFCQLGHSPSQLQNFFTVANRDTPRPISLITISAVNSLNRMTDAGGYESVLDVRLKVDGSSWLAVRCYEERPDGRLRFAHTAPWHVEVDGKPLRPRRAEVDYLVKRVEEQLKRSAGVLPEAALAEYRVGLRTYQELLRAAR
jgi:hypothetical protein